MNLLAKFQWYRRARGGYWAQVTAFFGTRWVHISGQPTSNREWIFYPWGKSEMGNGYIDEWYSVDPHVAMPLSHALNEAIGTADPQEIKRRLTS